MKKVYIITWKDIISNKDSMFGISGVLSTLKATETALERLKKYETEELEDYNYERATERIENFENGFRVNYGDGDYKEYKVIVKEVGVR